MKALFRVWLLLRFLGFRDPVLAVSAFDLLLHSIAATGTAAAAALLASSTLTTAVELNEWQLMNGDVRLPDPLELNLPTTSASSSSSSTRKILLQNPTLIGAGGGGAVFRFGDDQPDDDVSDILLKVSWAGSTKSVIRECRTLQLLERKNVGSAERCLGEFPYDYAQQSDDDKGQERVMIAVTPYVRNAVASVDAVNGRQQQRVAVRQIAQTVIQMLAANVVTIDVQPLIDQQTGNVIFVDMMEAQELRPPFSFLDQVLIGSFVTEMLTLVPDQFVDVASKAMVQEIAALEAKGVSLSDQAKDVLHSQTLFFPE